MCGATGYVVRQVMWRDRLCGPLATDPVVICSRLATYRHIRYALLINLSK